MSRYRWLSSRTTLETMEHFPDLAGRSYEQLKMDLFAAVQRGDVRSMLNDEIVPRAHIAGYLSLFGRAHPDGGPHTLPADLALNYDDLRAVFDRPTPDRRKRGRPPKESGWSQDRQLAFEMHKRIAREVPLARSAADAARQLVAEGKVAGAGTPESLAKRLEKAFRRYYSS